MGRKILAVVVALIAAFAVIMIVEMCNSLVVMPPGPEIVNDPVRLREFMTNLPTLAYIVVLVGYVLGSFTGGYIVRTMSRRESPGISLAILVGVVSLALGTGDLRRNRPTPPEPAARDPYTAEDFYSPPCYPRRARSPSTACRFTSTRTPMVRTL